MSSAYQRGYRAGLRRTSPEDCPYAGSAGASAIQRQRWLEGYAVGRRAGYRPRRRGETYRKRSATRSGIRSVWVRERIREALR